jgi:hypothetical protein
MEKIMTEANYKHMKARPDLGSIIKFAIAAALGIGIGFYVAQTMSHEPTTASEAAAGPGTESEAVGDGPGYLPSQIVNQAKKTEPLPQTF